MHAWWCEDSSEEVGGSVYLDFDIYFTISNIPPPCSAQPRTANFFLQTTDDVFVKLTRVTARLLLYLWAMHWKIKTCIFDRPSVF
jgi:hypothetical protein